MPERERADSGQKVSVFVRVAYSFCTKDLSCNHMLFMCSMPSEPTSSMSSLMVAGKTSPSQAQESLLATRLAMDFLGSMASLVSLSSRQVQALYPVMQGVSLAHCKNLHWQEQYGSSDSSDMLIPSCLVLLGNACHIEDGAWNSFDS